MDFLYNKFGEAVAYSEDDKTIWSISGKPLGYINSQDLIYNWHGRQVGFYENGWFFDANGCHTFFYKNSTGGPIKPLLKIDPIVSVKSIRPLNPIESLPLIKPITYLGWSIFYDDKYFK